MGMVYQWKDAACIHIDAQAAGEELERIRTLYNGRLDSEMVVEAARIEASPLHDHFEWDDQEAAKAYRIEQASYLIRSITVEVEKPDGGTANVRAFVNVKRDEDRSYTSVQHALSDQELRAQVVKAALLELDAWRQRHAELVELARIFSAIDEARGAE